MRGIETLTTDAPILAVYAVWNTVNGKQFIGSRAHHRHRLLCTSSALGSSNSLASSLVMEVDAKQYGVYSIAASVVQICKTEDGAEQLDKTLIAELQPEYNVTASGGKARTTRIVSGVCHCPCGGAIRSDFARWARARAVRKKRAERQNQDLAFRARQATNKRPCMARIMADSEKHGAPKRSPEYEAGVPGTGAKAKGHSEAPRGQK